MSKGTIYSILIGFISLLLIGLILPEYENSLKYNNVKWIWIYSVLLSTFLFLFGILIEGKRLKQIFVKKIEVNWLLMSLVGILILLVFIPQPFWLVLLPKDKTLLNFLFKNEIHVVLNILAGILFVRSFNIKN